MQKVIVIGGNHHNTLGVIRALGRKGVNPYVILTASDKEPFVAKCKYITEIWTDLKPSEVPHFLLTNFTDRKEKPVLIACNDTNSFVLDENRNELSNYFVVPGTKDGQLKLYMNKLEMSLMADKNGLTVPYSSVVYDGYIDEDLQFPCIVKPEFSNRGTKKDINIFENKECLRKFLKGNPKRYNIQHFIDKQFEYQLIGCSLNNGEEIIIPGYSKLIRPGNGSNTGFLCYDNYPDDFLNIIERSKHFIKETGYNGLFSVEFLRGKDGIDYFMEINFRNDGNGISVTNAGVNLPYIWYLYNTGAEFRNEIKSITKQYVMPEFTELSMWYSGQISWRNFRADMKLATSYMDYDSEDPAPTCGWCNYRKMLINMMIKKPVKSFISLLKGQ